MKHLLFILFVSGLALGLASCQKQSDNTPETRALAADDSMVDFADRAIEGPADALTMRSSQFGPCGQGSSPFLPACVTITDSGEGVYPRTLTLDFGDGCTGPGGWTRSGVIDIVVTGDLREDVGASRTITFTDYTAGPVTMFGTRTLTFLGDNAEGQPSYAQHHDFNIQRNGHTVHRLYDGTLAWLEGFDTDDCDDNVVQRDGLATHSANNAWGTTTRTIEAVVHDRPCGYPVSGTITVDRPMHDVVIDFGDGTCDNLATVTRNGNTVIIDLDTHDVVG
jgi:hypothetical protein